VKLLERDSSLAVLAEARADAAGGSGSVVFVTGEPGIGKTALVNEFVAGPDAGDRVLVGTCDDLSVPRPFGPFHDLSGPPATRLHDALCRGAPPHEVHSALLDELGALPRPTVLVIEDLHWADEATLDAITVFGRRISKLPAMLVLTYRNGEVDAGHQLHAVVGALRTDPSRHLELAPLSRLAVASMTGDDADRIYDESGGNPFYVTELIAAHPAELPPSVSNAVLGRASKLDPRSRRLIELVSMVPSRVAAPVLDAVMPGWVAAAEEPERRNLLHVDVNHVRFRHELARAAIRSNVPVARRRRLYGEILDALLALGADPAEIVHHADQAGRDDVVADHALLAARQATAAESNREAYAHYRRATEFVDRQPIREQAAVFEELTEVAYTVERLDDAFTAVERAIALYTQASDQLAAGRCLRLRSRLHWCAGRGDEARRDALLAVDVLEPLGPSLELARACGRLSQLAMRACDDEQAIAWGARTLELNKQLGDERVRANALIEIGIAKSNRDPDDTGVLHRAFDVADRAGDRLEAVRALIALAWVDMLWVRPARSAAYTDRGIAYAEEHQVDSLLAYLNATRAWLRLRAGDWQAAEATARHEVEKGITVAQLLAETVLAELAVRRGDADAAARLAEVRDRADQTGELQRIAPVLELEIEWALTRNEQMPRRRFDQAISLVGPDHGSTVGGGRLAGWSAVAGFPHARGGHLPAPHEAMLAGDWARAADAFGAVGWSYDRALMLSLLDSAEALGEALEIARTLGAAPLVDRVARRMRELRMRVRRGPQASTRVHPAGLTQRQAEVLDLLADGLTNVEIAGRLIVSRRTVEHHVEAILAKLGVPSRREAARRHADLFTGDALIA
jgi:DNA-binding CsgD family transcriptional regulator/tetratricopeptide (TPR) repeat protein